jgi:hypothetical protein
MILANWLRRASEEQHSSTVPNPRVEGLFFALERFDVFLGAILAASYAAISMVVQLEANGLEARFWPTSG